MLNFLDFSLDRFLQIYNRVDRISVMELKYWIWFLVKGQIGSRQLSRGQFFLREVKGELGRKKFIELS